MLSLLKENGVFSVFFFRFEENLKKSKKCEKNQKNSDLKLDFFFFFETEEKVYYIYITAVIVFNPNLQL